MRRRAVAVCCVVWCAALLPAGAGSAAADAPSPAGLFHGVTPARLLETRGAPNSTVDDLFEGGGAIGAAATIDLDVAGRGGVPDGAGAVALNVTAISPTATSFITIYPTGQPRPTASNLNLAAGRTVPNMVIVPLGTGGHIDIYNQAGTSHLAVDVLGWFPKGDTAFGGLTPARLLETRGAPNSTIDDQYENLGTIGAASTTELDIAGRGGVPDGAGAVALNVTAINPTATSFITIYPTGQPRPTASNLNLTAGRTLPNMVIVPLGTDGHIDIYNQSGTTHLAVDVLGWFPTGADVSIVSLDSDELQVDGSSYAPEISGNGQFVAFYSDGRLVADDNNADTDVYVRDLTNGDTERVSVSSAGVEADDVNYTNDISDDGRFVVFHGRPTNLVANDNNLTWDVYVRDRQTDTTTRVSVATGGTEADKASYNGSISNDGRYVVFATEATNLAGDDTNTAVDIALHDRQTGTTTIISRSSVGDLANDSSSQPRISGDGAYVVFESTASNLVAGDTNGIGDVFLYQRATGAVERISVADNEAQVNGLSQLPRLSDDGRYVVFTNYSTNIDPAKTQDHGDIFLRDTVLDTTTLITTAHDGGESSAGSYYSHISGDGSTIVFESYATNLTSAPTAGNSNVFLYERSNGTISLVSVSSEGLGTGTFCAYPTTSNNGMRVVFMSDGILVPSDANAARDIYLYDRGV